MKNTTTKKIELGVNTKNVKVQFNTSTQSFRDAMGNYWVAIVEMADMVKIFSNNVKVLSESVAKLQEKIDSGETLSESDKTRFEMDIKQLKEYNDKFIAYREECNRRFEDCYKLILTNKLYEAYNTYATKQSKNNFKKELGMFLKTHNIESTNSLVDFLLSVVGLRVAPTNTKVKTKGTTLLIAQTEKRFNETFMHALAQLMVDKNCIKTDNYTFVYEKSSATHIDSKIDTVEIPSENVVEENNKKTMTKKQLMEALDKASIAYKKSMKLSELVELYNTISESTEEN